MPVVDLTSKDLWDTILQVLDADSEHICVLPMTTFIEPVRSVTVVQIDTRVDATASTCPPGSKNLHAKPAVEPEQSTAEDDAPVDTILESEQPEPTEIAEPAPEPPRIVEKSEIDLLLTDPSYSEQLQQLYPPNNSIVHPQAKGVLYRNILTLSTFRTGRPDILFQVDLETGEVVNHMLSRGQLHRNIEQSDGTQFEFRPAEGERTVIDIADFSTPDDVPRIISADVARMYIWDWGFNDKIQAIYNTLRPKPASTAILYKNTLTFATESDRRNAVIVQLDTGSNELVGHKIGSATTYPNVDILEGTQVKFTDSQGENEEVIDVANFGPMQDPPYEPLIISVNEAQQRISKAKASQEISRLYARDTAVAWSCEGVLYKDILTTAFRWYGTSEPENSVFIQLNTKDNRLVAAREARATSLHTVQRVDGTLFKFISRRGTGEDTIDILDLGPRLVSASDVRELIRDWSFTDQLNQAYGQTRELQFNLDYAIRHEHILTLSMDWKYRHPSILVQLNTETGELVAHRPGVAKPYSSVEKDPSGPTMYAFRGNNTHHVIDVANFGAPNIVSGYELRNVIDSKPLTRLSLAYGGRAELESDQSAVLYEDTVTTVFWIYKTSVFAQFKVGTGELIAHKPNNMRSSFHSIEHQAGTTFDFIGYGDEREPLDVAAFTTQGEPLPEPPAKAQRFDNWPNFISVRSVKDKLKEIYQNDQRPSPDSGYLYGNKFVGIMTWRDKSNVIFVQFDYETGDMRAHKQGSAPRYNSTSMSSSSPKVTFRATQGSTIIAEDIIDIRDLNA